MRRGRSQMNTTVLTIICLALGAICAFFLLRLSRASGLAESLEQKKQEQDKDIKKLKERLKKLEKKAQATGSGQAREDKKVQTLQESVNNLRKDLADARKAARKAEERMEEAQQKARNERRNFEEQLPKAPAVTPVEDEVVELATPEEKEVRTPDEDALQQKLTSIAHSEDHLKREVESLSDSLKQQKKKYNDGRHEWAKARRKYEDLRRAYIITKGQLEITQDMLAALESHTGVSASDGLLAQNPRAKKRQEIQKHRVEQKMQAEMPEAAH